ncbi:MAG: alpha-1,6-mannosyltransferase [Paraglaciecola sp.]
MDFNLKNSILASILIFLTIYLGYFTQQADFLRIIGCYLPFFAIYAYILKKIDTKNTIYFFVATGIFLRLVLLFSYPNLSDDLYRFIWDGRLLINGFNPFDHLPTHYIDNKIAVEGITPELFAKLNSPEYFTIYPPIAQLTFATAVGLFPNSIWGSALVMKLFLFLFETGSILLIIKLLQKLKLPLKNVLIYALNPLIIIEICGNLHFEGAMIFFLLLAVWLLFLADIKWSKVSVTFKSNAYFMSSAIVFALSIASKLLPLIFLPFFIKRLGWKKSIQYFTIIGITLAILFLPLINGVFIKNFGNSLNLYFQKFEFNASIYYFARWIGFQTTGWNMIAVIGPALAICTPISIFLMVGREKIERSPPAPKGEQIQVNNQESYHLSGSNSPLEARGQHATNSLNIWRTLLPKLLFAICIYLFFTTTVHPWYVALPLVLCCFTRFRFPVIWSGFIVLTYINYSYPIYQENLWIVGLEYVTLGLFLTYELKLTNKFPQVRYLRGRIG